jgi:hypothetical protein
MLKWYAFLVLLGMSVIIFIFAPLGLVGHFISRFTPAGLEWVGIAFSIGLSLSVVANSFLARWKSMRLALVALVVLAIAESLMSGATFYAKALEDGSLDLVIGIGIIAIIAVQEIVLSCGGVGMSLVLDKIGTENDRLRQMAERRQSRQLSRPHDDKLKTPRMVAPPVAPEMTTVAPTPPPAPIGATVARPMTRTERLDAIRRVNATRNGDGPLTAEQIVATFGVSLRQAQRDARVLKADT